MNLYRFKILLDTIAFWVLKGPEFVPQSSRADAQNVFDILTITAQSTRGNRDPTEKKVESKVPQICFNPQRTMTSRAPNRSPTQVYYPIRLPAIEPDS